MDYPGIVLEHHCNIILETEEEQAYYDRVTEDWALPVIVTTAVQFLNTLFAGKAGNIRRMYSLCNSVIIMDEVQSLPVRTIQLFNMAVNFLTEFANTTMVLCTATQPLLDRIPVNRLRPTNDMAGHVDFTPGAMRNGTRDNWKAIYTKPISMGTRCHQAACYIVQDSPFTMLADTPTNYEADEPYTRYIASLPVVFDKTIVPQGEIGKYIVTARKKGNDWYVGGQSNWDERTLTLKFDFLADGDYEAIVLKDGINANHDAEDYKIEKSVINQKSEMKIHLASGGGFVIKVIKK